MSQSNDLGVVFKRLTSEEETYSEYLDLIDNYINVVKGKTVLEIGSCNFWMTERIASHEPKSIVTLEPNSESVMAAQKDSSIPTGVVNHTLTADDYFHTFDTKFDVIFCVGVLYHLHSPLHLIEQLCNNRPETLIVETTNVPAYDIYMRSHLYPERMHGEGIAQKSHGIKKQIPYKILFPNEIYESLIKGFGYKIIKKEQVTANYSSKTNVFIWHFELDPSLQHEWQAQPQLDIHQQMRLDKGLK